MTSLAMRQERADPFHGLLCPMVDRPNVLRLSQPRPKSPKPVPAAPKQPKVQPIQPANPWGLSAAEEAAMRAVCLHGDHEEAARSLGIDHRTVEYHMGQCRKRMGAKNRVLAILEWDRYARGAA